LKDIYYSTLGRLTAINYLWRRAFPKIPNHGRVILHLGSGDHYIDQPGFINIDGNLFPRKDLWLDITRGLPFPDESVDGVYASHVLEHFSEENVHRILQESFRVLKRGGGIRLVTPHLGRAIEAYVREDMNFFSDWPDHRDSLGGQFNNHLLCRDQHRLMFDFGFMRELLIQAGFEHCGEVSPEESKILPGSVLRENQQGIAEDPRSLFVEAFKL
jgi:predicted SAM-dependent methyltransferase